MDLPQSKAEPISDSGSSSVIKYLRRGKKLPATATTVERGVIICDRNNSADTKVSEEGGAPGAGADYTAASGEDNEEAGCPLCSSYRSTVE